MTVDITVADLNVLLAVQGPYRDHLRRGVIANRGSYKEFIDQFYVDLDACIDGLRTVREQLQEDDEDRLTSDIVLQLGRQGYIASHDKKAGGHIDISVESGPHSWIGEAKKDWSIDEGLLQLTTRYIAVSGNPNHDHGGLLFYLTKTADTRTAMEKWRTKLEADAVTCLACIRNRLAFFSEIKLPGTGLPFHVRSMGVALYFHPEDRSGVATRVRRATRATKAKSG